MTETEEKMLEAEPGEEKAKDPRDGWYVVHVLTEYENKVKTDLEQTIVNRKLEDRIFEVVVPMEEVVELKNGVKKVVQRKMYPGYVIVHMILDDDIWYVVRNTHGVTGFAGPDYKATPLSPKEVEDLKLGSSKRNVVVDFKVGDPIMIVNDPWNGTAAVIKSINVSKQTATVYIDVFGRETPVDLAFSDIKHM